MGFYIDISDIRHLEKKTSPDELWEEYSALGFLRNTHPLVLWKDKPAAFKRIKAVWLPRYVGGEWN
jgi:hypothetical protein